MSVLADWRFGDGLAEAVRGLARLPKGCSAELWGFDPAPARRAAEARLARAGVAARVRAAWKPALHMLLEEGQGARELLWPAAAGAHPDRFLRELHPAAELRPGLRLGRAPRRGASAGRAGGVGPGEAAAVAGRRGGAGRLRVAAGAGAGRGGAGGRAVGDAAGGGAGSAVGGAAGAGLARARAPFRNADGADRGGPGGGFPGRGGGGPEPRGGAARGGVFRGSGAAGCGGGAAGGGPEPDAGADRAGDRGLGRGGAGDGEGRRRRPERGAVGGGARRFPAGDARRQAASAGAPTRCLGRSGGVRATERAGAGAPGAARSGEGQGDSLPAIPEGRPLRRARAARCRFGARGGLAERPKGMPFRAAPVGGRARRWFGRKSCTG